MYSAVTPAGLLCLNRQRAVAPIAGSEQLFGRQTIPRGIACARRATNLPPDALARTILIVFKALRDALLRRVRKDAQVGQAVDEVLRGQGYQ